jgi:hypothetical protein
LISVVLGGCSDVAYQTGTRVEIPARCRRTGPSSRTGPRPRTKCSARTSRYGKPSVWTEGLQNSTLNESLGMEADIARPSDYGSEG